MVKRCVYSIKLEHNFWYKAYTAARMPERSKGGDLRSLVFHSWVRTPLRAVYYFIHSKAFTLVMCEPNNLELRPIYGVIYVKEHSFSGFPNGMLCMYVGKPFQKNIDWLKSRFWIDISRVQTNQILCENPYDSLTWSTIIPDIKPEYYF